MVNGHTAEEFVEAIKEAKGFVSVAARRLGCSRSTMYRAIERYSSVAEAVKDARESMTDLAEGKLLEQIKEGNTTAIIFYLKTQGRERGYIEYRKHDIEHTGSKEKPIIISLVKMDIDEL
jgi:hypothetical protein